MTEHIDDDNISRKQDRTAGNWFAIRNGRCRFVEGMPYRPVLAVELARGEWPGRGEARKKMVLLFKNSLGNPDLTPENAEAPIEREVAANIKSRGRNQARARRFQVKAEVFGNALKVPTGSEAPP